jgi:hypothetical protein
MPIDAAQMIVAPHSLVPAIGDGLVEVATESEDFDRRFCIRTSDRAFATAVMDARMTEWFLGSHDEVVFETGGRWLLVSSSGYPGTDALDGIVEALELFAEHVPRVVRSLYPADPPPIGSMIDPWGRS